jgi:uncharacterized protein YycO
MKTPLSFKSRAIGCLLVCLILLSGAGKGGEHADSVSANQVKPSGSRQINRWLDYDFDQAAPMGSAKNPAIILPAEMSSLLGSLPGVKRQGETVFVPAAEFKKAASMPFAGAMLSPIISQLSNVKSFDGFSAVDGTGLIKKVPSLLYEPDTIGRRLTAENPESNGRLLQNGDLVFGSHVVNFMTWGRYNHVAIVTDAAQGILVEATAEVPSDKPGVRSIDWKSFSSGYVHVGIVRVKGVQTNQMARVIRWVEERKGKPYRWPIIMGLDTSDESRFYCSQLAWLAYKKVLNIDLDNDQGVLIFPDDLYESSYAEKIVP